MRNAFDDLYANSFAFREAERMRCEFQNLLSVRQQTITDLIAGQSSALWKDVASQNALKMSELVNGIDRNSHLTAASMAIQSIAGMQSAAKISELIVGSIKTDSFLAAAEAANASIAKILADTQAGYKLPDLGKMISKEWMIPQESRWLRDL
jgi:hypothetical protein